MKIEISDNLLKAIEQRVEMTDEFESVGEYINYILKQFVSNLDQSDVQEDYSEEDEKKVKQRLKALGYLD